MRYISLFSGIEGASVAWGPLGWTPVVFAEIDAFASAVLGFHYPSIANVGDVTTVNWGDFAGTADVVIFGSPCQSFSVAGKREGLDDPRGNLALHAIRAITAIRPRYIVFENVPGLLSSRNGRDFAAFLRAVRECGYLGCWRSLDCQFAGLAQRRQRVIAVFHIGDWRPPAAVLFEPESLSGHPPPRREAGADVADPITASFAKHGGRTGNNGGVINLVVGTLTGSKNRGGWRCGADEAAAGHVVVFAEHQCGQGYPAIRQAIMTVRRLTPLECERLQGYPDDYTRVPYRGKPADKCPDGNRYRALGNAFAVPDFRWIGERIGIVDGIVRARGQAA